MPILKIVATSISKRALKFQDKLGYQLQFKNVPANWLQLFTTVEMTKTWQKFGLNIQGLNYFTMGSIKKGASSRFIRKDKMYQAWFGGYLFKSNQAISWNIADYAKLAEADQKKWLRYYGIKNAEMDFRNPSEKSKIDDISINGFEAKTYRWVGTTQSDVGLRSNNLYNRLAMGTMAEIINYLNKSKSKLSSKNFIKQSRHHSHEQLEISGYMIIVDIEEKIKALLYICMHEPSKDDWQKMEKTIKEHLLIKKKQVE